MDFVKGLSRFLRPRDLKEIESPDNLALYFSTSTMRNKYFMTFIGALWLNGVQLVMRVSFLASEKLFTGKTTLRTLETAIMRRTISYYVAVCRKNGIFFFPHARMNWTQLNSVCKFSSDKNISAIKIALFFSFFIETPTLQPSRDCYVSYSIEWKINVFTCRIILITVTYLVLFLMSHRWSFCNAHFPSLSRRACHLHIFIWQIWWIASWRDEYVSRKRTHDVPAEAENTSACSRQVWRIMSS